MSCNALYELGMWSAHGPCASTVLEGFQGTVTPLLIPTSTGRCRCTPERAMAVGGGGHEPASLPSLPLLMYLAGCPDPAHARPCRHPCLCPCPCWLLLNSKEPVRAESMVERLKPGDESGCCHANEGGEDAPGGQRRPGSAPGGSQEVLRGQVGDRPAGGTARQDSLPGPSGVGNRSWPPFLWASGTAAELLGPCCARVLSLFCRSCA